MFAICVAGGCGFNMFAQEALKYSIAGADAAASRRAERENQPYTVQAGPWRFLFTGSLAAEWNDNINLSFLNPQEDLLLWPRLDMKAMSFLRGNTSFDINLGGSYLTYVSHSDYNRFVISPDSVLSMDVTIGDLRLNAHNYLTGIQQPTDQAEISGSAKFEQLNNTTGIQADYDMSDLKLSAGYDHNIIRALDSQYEYLGRDTEMVFTRANLSVHPGVAVGVETAGSYAQYRLIGFQDFLNGSIGPFITWRINDAINVRVRGGITAYHYLNSAGSQKNSDSVAEYYALTWTHQINKAFSYSLDGGRELQPGINANLYDSWHVAGALSWRVAQGLYLNPSVGYEHGEEGGATLFNNSQIFALTRKYSLDRYYAGVSLAKRLGKRLNAELAWKFYTKQSELPNSDYTQHSATLTLRYQF